MTKYEITLTGNETKEQRNELVKIKDNALELVGFAVVNHPNGKTLWISNEHKAETIKELIEKHNPTKVIAK